VALIQQFRKQEKLMSWSERFVRDHKRQTDCAIRRAYAQLALDPLVFEKFNEILYFARKRATRLFEAPVVNGRHLGVDALVHLSRFNGAHIRPAADWTGTASSWRPAITSLAHHLICEYKVPAFLASSWYAADSIAERKRSWFVAHSRGNSFRSLNLPIVMTRRMEHLFLASPDHLPIEHAIRKAELLALKVPAAILKEIMSSRLATDLRHGEFWRTVWMFFTENADEVDPTQISPIIDYIYAVRQERTSIPTPDGMITFEPPQPAFSIKGRSMQSILRLMREWHKSLGVGGSTFSWMRSPFEPLIFEESSQDDSGAPPRRWHMVELTNSAQLRSEGTALHHCVASYAYRCYQGASSIWSLRFWQGEKIHYVLTVEVDPRKRTVVQARGRANRTASGKPLRLLQDWALRERLQMAI
jgi:PcfJ-like protein